MGRPVSMDLRLRLLAAIDDGMSCRAAAARFGVAPSTATLGEIGGECLEGFILGVSRHRILQIEYDGIGASGRRLGIALRTISGNEEKTAHRVKSYHVAVASIATGPSGLAVHSLRQSPSSDALRVKEALL